MPTKLKNLKIKKVDLVDRGAGEGVAVTLFKRDSGTPPREAKPMNLEEIMALLPEDAQAALAALLEGMKQKPADEGEPKPAEPAKAEGEMEDEEKQKMEDEEDEEEAIKRLPLSVQKRLAENEDLKKRLEKIEDERETEIFKRMAEDFRYVPGATIEELAQVLKGASKTLDQKYFDILTKVLGNANEAVKKSDVMAQHGTATPSNSSINQIDAIAKGMQKADPKLNYSQAFTKALEQNPELYADHRREDKRG